MTRMLYDFYLIYFLIIHFWDLSYNSFDIMFITYLNSMAYGTEHGLVVVDIVQKVCLLNMASPDLYGAQDPYSRSPRSPKRVDNIGDQGRSPSIDQVSLSVGNRHFTSDH